MSAAPEPLRPPTGRRADARRWSALLAIAGLIVIASGLAIWSHGRHGVVHEDHAAVTISEHVRATTPDSIVNVPPAKPDAEILLKVPAQIFAWMRARLGAEAPPTPPQFDAILFPSGFALEQTNPSAKPYLKIGNTTYSPGCTSSIHQTGNDRIGTDYHVAGYVETLVTSGRSCRVYFDAVVRGSEASGDLQAVDADVTWRGPFDPTEPVPVLRGK